MELRFYHPLGRSTIIAIHRLEINTIVHTKELFQNGCHWQLDASARFKIFILAQADASSAAPYQSPNVF